MTNDNSPLASAQTVMNPIDELIGVFRLEASERIGELIELLQAERDAPSDRNAFIAAGRLVHNLKGAALTVCAQRLIEPLSTIESELEANCVRNELASTQQIDGWLDTLTDLSEGLSDPNVVPSALLAAVTRTDVPVGTRTPSETGTVEASGVATAHDRAADASASSTISIETRKIDLVVRAARDLARRCQRLMESASLLEGWLVENPNSAACGAPDGTRQRDLTCALRQIPRDLRTFEQLIQTLTNLVGQLGQTELPATGNPRKTRILVVDDSIIVRTVVAQNLSAAGYEVACCADGEEAWALLEPQKYDLLVCDLQMPCLDGLGLTKRIRASASLRYLPVVLLTGQATSLDISRGAEVGADGYVAKDDLERGELVATIRRLLGQE